MVSNRFSLRYSPYLFRISVESVSSGGGAIFIQANSSVYLRDNSYSAYSKKYEPITTGVYVNPRNFDIVRIEGLRTDPGDCPIDMTGTSSR